VGKNKSSWYTYAVRPKKALSAGLPSTKTLPSNFWLRREMQSSREDLPAPRGREGGREGRREGGRVSRQAKERVIRGLAVHEDVAFKFLVPQRDTVEQGGLAGALGEGGREGAGK